MDNRRHGRAAASGRRDPPDRGARRPRPIHRAGAGQLLGAPRVPALAAAAGGRARVGALEHRARHPLAGRGPGSDGGGPGALSRARAGAGGERDAGGHRAGELQARRALCLDGPAGCGPRRRAGRAGSRAPTCCSTSSTGSRSCSRTPTSRTGPTISEDERRARGLLARACACEEPSGEDVQLAERIGFELSGSYRPFVLVAPAWSVQRHLALAGRLRARHLVAVSEGRRVAGLSHRSIPWRELGVDPRAVIAAGPADAAERSCSTRSTSCAWSPRWRSREGHSGRGRRRRSPRRAAAAPLAAAGRLACARACTTGWPRRTPSSRARSTR